MFMPPMRVIVGIGGRRLRWVRMSLRGREGSKRRMGAEEQGGRIVVAVEGDGVIWKGSGCVDRDGIIRKSPKIIRKCPKIMETGV